MGKESACSAGDPGSIPGSESLPGEGSGYPLQCSCLGNRSDRGAWRATVHGTRKESDTTEQPAHRQEMASTGLSPMFSWVPWYFLPGK